MDQEDPEQRIADLERQLAEQRRMAELQRQQAHRADATAPYQAVGQASFPAAPFGPQPPWNQAPFPGQPRLLIALRWVVPSLFVFAIVSWNLHYVIELAFPSIHVWESRIVCSGGYHLVRGANRKPDKCVSGSGESYVVGLEDFGFQLIEWLVCALILLPIAVIAVVTWRRLRPR
jgi:hypothetical protein